MTIKNKLKSFFDLSLIEEDLQKEECTKTFDKIKLFTLTKGKLFLSMLTFLAIVNILVLVNYNDYFIRATLSFLFLIIIPGLLIMLCFKIRELDFWEYLVYTVGLSISFIMFAGLAVNWILPWLGITDKPLSFWPILICFNIFLIAFWITAWIRNKDLKLIKINFPKLDLTNRIFFITPMLFPILSILGAFLLNNHGTNILTMIMLGGITIYILILTIFRKKLNENIYPWAILMISSALLLMFSLRGWHVSGWDILREYKVFQLTKEISYWGILNFMDAYNACLSITILPTILSLFLKINDSYIFKFIIPLIFSFTLTTTYIFLKRYTGDIVAFAGVFFIISQIGFFEMSVLPRQEIAFLFFGLMLLILFNKQINSTTAKALFLIFGLSMIVSHYSTTYITLALFLFTYLFYFILRMHDSKKNIPNIYKKLNSKKKGERNHYKNPYLTFILIILMFISAFLWYSQVTTGFDGLINTMSQSVEKFGKMFSEDVREEHVSIIDQFNIFYTTPNKNSLMSDYKNDMELEYKINKEREDSYLIEEFKDYNPIIQYAQQLPANIKRTISLNVYIFKKFIVVIIKLFIFTGIFYFLFFQIKKAKIDREYIIMMLGCITLICMIIFLPMLSLRYPIGRLYQQVSIILALPMVFGGLVLFKFLNKKKALLVIILILLINFLFVSQFVSQFIGNSEASMQLNNFGEIYNEAYTHETEIQSVVWFMDNRNKKDMVFADKFGRVKLIVFGGSLHIVEDISPLIINKNSYVFSDYPNVNEKRATIIYKWKYLNYNFPTDFLNKNKNKIYVNGGSEVFK